MKYIIGGLVIVFLICLFFLYRKINICKKETVLERKQKKYFESYFDLMIQWKQLEQNGQKITQRLFQEGYSKIAVYGMKKIGWILCNELSNAGIHVAYAIDRDADALAYNAFSDIPDVKLCLPDDNLEEVDLIIVTAIQSYQEIRTNLTKRYPYKIVSLKEVIDNM